MYYIMSMVDKSVWKYDLHPPNVLHYHLWQITVLVGTVVLLLTINIIWEHLVLLRIHIHLLPKSLRVVFIHSQLFAEI